MTCVFRMAHNARQGTYAKMILNTPVIYFVKLSILLQFSRLFAPVKSGTFYWSIQALIWLNTLFYIICMFTKVFQCSPVNKAWQPWLPGRCFDMNVLLSASSLINLFSDLLILLIPIFRISSLRMHTLRKIGVASIFLVGVL